MEQELIWKIIDMYFTNDPYTLIKHQQNSYNLFFEKEIYKIFNESYITRIWTTIRYLFND